MAILEQLAANIADWPELLPRSAMVTIAAGTVTQAHNEIERLRAMLITSPIGGNVASEKHGNTMGD